MFKVSISLKSGAIAYFNDIPLNEIGSFIEVLVRAKEINEVRIYPSK